MKSNRFRQMLAEGKTPVGHGVFEFSTRGIAQLVEAADVDFVLLDMEHSGFGMNQIADLLAWFKGTSVAPFVRVPQLEYHFIARVLDAGALGVMVPNVQTGEQAKAAVDAVKYAPLGKRGVGVGGANTDYRDVNTQEYLRWANETTTVICQIESQEAINNLEAIAGTPGVDVLWIGHFDLSQSMGIPGQFANARFLDAMKKVIAAAKKHGVASAIQPRDLAQAQEWLPLGFTFMSYGIDRTVYLAALREGVSKLRQILAR